MAEMDLEQARAAFVNAMRPGVPKSAQLVVRPGAVAEATAIHCTWPLEEKGPFSKATAREITVQVYGAAMAAFRAADPEKRGVMLRQFAHIVDTRLADGGYNPQDPSPPVFLITIDEHSLDT